MSHSQAEEKTPGTRLQKVLAAAGVGSRRVCEDLIDAGRVTVNGSLVREQGLRVDPQTAVILVDGDRVNVRSDLVYLALNKPKGVLSAMTDSRGRPTVGDYVAEREQRLFHVGRLDAETEGLILLTNDGELAHRLTHPSFGVQKTYLAAIPGPIPRDLGRRLRAGVELEDGRVAADGFRLIQSVGGRALVELVLHEGRKHVVRRLLAEVGHPVSSLSRTAFGPIRLGHQRQGTVRKLDRRDVAELYRLAGLDRA